MLAADLESAEARFERLRGRVGLITAPLALLVLWNLPLALEPRGASPGGDPRRRRRALGDRGDPDGDDRVPRRRGRGACCGSRRRTEAFAPFADPLIFLFIGTFMLAQAIFFHGLDRRFAFAILGAARRSASSRGRVLAAYAVVTCVHLDVDQQHGDHRDDVSDRRLAARASLELDAAIGASAAAGFATALLLSTSFAASIGGLATPVGTPPNLIGIGFIRRETGVDVPFFTWMALGVPDRRAAARWSCWRPAPRRRRRAARDLHGVAALVAARAAALGPWTRGQMNTLDRLRLHGRALDPAGLHRARLRPGASARTRSSRRTLPEGVVALLGAALLFVLPTDLRAPRVHAALGGGGARSTGGSSSSTAAASRSARWPSRPASPRRWAAGSTGLLGVQQRISACSRSRR